MVLPFKVCRVKILDHFSLSNLEVLFEENDNDGGGGGMNDGCNIYQMHDQITVMLYTLTLTLTAVHTSEQLKSEPGV